MLIKKKMSREIDLRFLYEKERQIHDFSSKKENMIWLIRQVYNEHHLDLMSRNFLNTDRSLVSSLCLVLRLPVWSPQNNEHGQTRGRYHGGRRQVTTVFTVQPLFHHRHSTNRVFEVLPSSANDEVRRDCTFADDGNAS